MQAEEGGVAHVGVAAVTLEMRGWVSGGIDEGMGCRSRGGSCDSSTDGGRDEWMDGTFGCCASPPFMCARAPTHGSTHSPLLTAVPRRGRNRGRV